MKKQGPTLDEILDMIHDHPLRESLTDEEIAKIEPIDEGEQD